VIEKLFVYGTLGPGRPNEHVLDAVGGSWETATVSGTLREEGWGAVLHKIPLKCDVLPNGPEQGM